MNHTTIIGTTKQSQKYVFFRKFDVFQGKNGGDCEDKTYSKTYVLKFLEIVLPVTLKPLKHISTTTNCTTIGTFTLHTSLLLVDVAEYSFVNFVNESMTTSRNFFFDCREGSGPR